MAIDLQLIGWKAHGLRCPDHEVSFHDDTQKVYPVTLVQMPTGTGKTTTLELLRTVLSGSASDWPSDHIRQFQKRDSTDPNGLFQVVLSYNGRRLTLRMEFDFENGKVNYFTTYRKGLQEGFQPPRELQKFLNPNFIKYFIFDGELAGQLLDRNNTNAQRVIEVLFQLIIFSMISNRIDEYWDDITRKSGAREQRGLSRKQNECKSLRNRINSLKAAKRMLEEERETLEKELEEKAIQYEAVKANWEDLTKKLEVVNEKKVMAQNEVERITTDVLAMMRDPHALSRIIAEEIVQFKASLDRLKLPESTAREFFEELAEEDECICGRSIGKSESEIIRRRAKDYLGSDHIALLNGIKGDVSNLIGQESSVHEEELNDMLSLLDVAIKTEDRYRNEYHLLESEGIGGDPDVEGLRDRINDLNVEISECKERLEELDSRHDPGSSVKPENISAIPVLEARLKTAKDEVEQITNTIGLREKGEIVKRILADAHELAQSRINDEICIEANNRISELLPHNALRIQEIDKSLVLHGQEGGSVGENLSIAYAFLSTLFSSAKYHHLPFIVDSPAGALDGDVREEVANLIPNLTRQFIAFTISTEQQRFLPALESAAGDEIQYITLFRKGPQAYEARARLVERTSITEDGFCVPGQAFFKEFQLESEDDGNAI